MSRKSDQVVVVKSTLPRLKAPSSGDVTRVVSGERSQRYKTVSTRNNDHSRGTLSSTTMAKTLHGSERSSGKSVTSAPLVAGQRPKSSPQKIPTSTQPAAHRQTPESPSKRSERSILQSKKLLATKASGTLHGRSEPTSDTMKEKSEKTPTVPGKRATLSPPKTAQPSISNARQVGGDKSIRRSDPITPRSKPLVGTVATKPKEGTSPKARDDRKDIVKTGSTTTSTLNGTARSKIAESRARPDNSTTTKVRTQTSSQTKEGSKCVVKPKPVEKIISSVLVDTSLIKASRLPKPNKVASAPNTPQTRPRARTLAGNRAHDPASASGVSITPQTTLPAPKFKAFDLELQPKAIRGGGKVIQSTEIDLTPKTSSPEALEVSIPSVETKAHTSRRSLVSNENLAQASVKQSDMNAQKPTEQSASMKTSFKGVTLEASKIKAPNFPKASSSLIQAAARPHQRYDRSGDNGEVPPHISPSTSILSSRMDILDLSLSQDVPTTLLTSSKSSSGKAGVQFDAENALRLHRHNLTLFEQREITEYKSIWFIGSGTAKAGRETPRTSPKPTNSSHRISNDMVFDDDNGDYRFTPHDHLAYRYEVLSEFGKGSFGRVLKCMDHKEGKLRAVKIIRNRKRFQSQALTEVKILGLLRKWDPEGKFNNVEMTDSFQFRGHICIAFECLGLNLYDILKRKNFQGFHPTQIRRIATQILNSLSLLHSRRIIHCDLKPENVLLHERLPNVVKVIDFGSSCFEHDKVYTYIQSRFYRAPEVILGIAYTIAIDIWSFGCILAELYTGQPLFPGENEHEQMACIMEVIGLPPATLIEGCRRKQVFFGMYHVSQAVTPYLTRRTLDSSGKPRPYVNAKGRSRDPPGSRSLSSILKGADQSFINFVTLCLVWDPSARLTAASAFSHPYIRALGRISNPTLSSRASLKQISALQLLPKTSRLALHNLKDYIGLPGMIVQLTTFDCGGIAIALKFAHVLADAQAMINFVRDWASVNRAMLAYYSLPSLSPVFKPSLLDQASAGDIDAPKADAALLNISRSLRLHRYDCRARGLENDEEEVHLDVTFGFRKHLSLPETFLGSPITNAKVSLSGREACFDSLEKKAVCVRSSLAQFNASTLPALLHDLAFQADPHRHWNAFLGSHNTIITSWLRLHVYGIDFGGKVPPRYVEAVMPNVDGCVQIMEAGVERDDSDIHPAVADNVQLKPWYQETVSISMHLATEVMQRLRRTQVESLAGKWMEETHWTPNQAHVKNEDAKIEYSPYPGAAIAQDRLEPLLRSKAIELGADLRQGTEFVCFEQDANGVTALVRERDGGKEYKIHAQYMIAADGARSPIREALGITRKGRGHIRTIRSVLFRALLDEYLQSGISQFEIEQPDLKAFLTTYQDGRWVLMFTDDIERDDKTLREAVYKAIGRTDLDIDIITTGRWELTGLIANQYSSGRVFLAGDAAHTLPPTRGGYGANTGIDDTYNLAWKLEAVLSGKSSPTLLDTYNAERQPIGWLRHQQTFARPDYAAQSNGVADGETILDAEAMELGQLYRSASIIGAETDLPPAAKPDEWAGQPGTRAQHLWVTQGDKRISTLDLFPKGWVLLTLDQQWKLIASKAQQDTGIHLECILVGANVKFSNNKEFQHAFGVGPTGASLIRPDGYIAWHSPDLPSDALQVFTTAFAQVTCAARNLRFELVDADRNGYCNASETYFITGASRGIGLEFVKELLAWGNKVIAGARNPSTATKLQGVKSDNLYIVQLDVLDINSIKQAYVEVNKIAPKGLDVIVNNAGTVLAFGLNLETDVLQVSRTFMPLLEKRQRRLLVTISSNVGSNAIVAGMKQNFLGASYLVSKAAVNMLNTVFTYYYEPNGIVVLPIHPGLVKTDLTSTMSAEITTQESVKGMLRVMDNFTIKDMEVDEYLLELNFILLNGETAYKDATKAFKITLPSTANTWNVRVAVQQECSRSNVPFRDIRLDKVDVYKASISPSESKALLQEIKSGRRIANSEWKTSLLDELDLLSDYFTEQPNKRAIHLIVDCTDALLDNSEQLLHGEGKMDISADLPESEATHVTPAPSLSKKARPQGRARIGPMGTTTTQSFTHGKASDNVMTLTPSRSQEWERQRQAREKDVPEQLQGESNITYAERIKRLLDWTPRLGGEGGTIKDEQDTSNGFDELEGIEIKDEQSFIDRRAKVDQLYDTLGKATVVLIRCPPMGGKTSFAQLLERKTLREQVTVYNGKLRVIRISTLWFRTSNPDWIFTEEFEYLMGGLSWEEFIRECDYINTLLIIDEAQASFLKLSCNDAC
ncbi:hypothetical protein BZG36_04329 [Bifiguratus adelaidae]|uniref:dual-specificity kinase n=1 Tax=Bifiguratus adelaidae TaxID=1938954 RepID=A0A261XW10_9FUNG|nr:hypothetical protein BZG36_04329 [Bifiguratus adelaidae]